MKFVVVAGPAGGGKTTWAQKLARTRGLPVIATDDFRGEGWEEVPGLVAEAASKMAGGTVVLEGVRALSAVYHNGWARDVAEVWWCDAGPGKPGSFCRGLAKRQRDLLDSMAGYLPRAQFPPPW